LRCSSFARSHLPMAAGDRINVVAAAIYRAAACRIIFYAQH
jgi:hypothetical protein